MTELATLADGSEPTPEQRLWAAVIQQAMRDAQGRDSLERTRARAWFKSGDFGMVADLAGLSPDGLRREMQRRLGEDRQAAPLRRAG